MTAQQQFDRSAALLSDVLEFTGTLTDIAVLAQIQACLFTSGPVITAANVEQIRQAISLRLFGKTKNGLDFARDGKKVLAFIRAYQNRWNDCLNDDTARLSNDVHEQLTRLCARWIVEFGEDGAKRKCVQFLNMELTDADWQHIVDAGGGFVKKMYQMEDTAIVHEKRALARAYTDARDNMAEHLEKLWLELFAANGVEGAVRWFRDNWHPEGQAAKDKVNAAFLAAKHRYQNKQNGSNF